MAQWITQPTTDYRLFRVPRQVDVRAVRAAKDIGCFPIYLAPDGPEERSNEPNAEFLMDGFSVEKSCAPFQMNHQ
jgi:hypothetical protein